MHSTYRSGATASSGAASRAPSPRSPTSTRSAAHRSSSAGEFRIESGEREDDEFYLEDLIGFRVEGIETRHEAEPLHFEGRLTDYYDSEANPLFELETGGRRLLVPAVEEFIAHIDFERRCVKLVLPEGMTDL